MSKARCKNCKEVIESKHRHDFVACKCFKNKQNTTGIFIDGGNDYRRCGGNFDNLEWLDNKLGVE